MYVYVKHGLFATYTRASGDVQLSINDQCIIEKQNSDLELATVRQIESENDIFYDKLVRKATDTDSQHYAILQNTIAEKTQTCNDFVRYYQLPIQLVGIDHSFDGGRFSFYFTSARSLNLKSLVKALATKYAVKIQFRQVGPREITSINQSCGACGLQTCCSRFLTEFKVVPYHLAQQQLQRKCGCKDDGVCSCNSSCGKLHGSCGKIKCCFNYEVG